MLKLYVVITEDGTNGFYEEGISSVIPSDAIEISQEDHDKFFSDNGKYIFVKSISAEIAGARTYILTKNFVEGNTITINEQTLTASAAVTPTGDFIIGSTIIESVQNLVNAIIRGQAATPIYDITIPATPDETFTITEITAGGGNTPSQAVCTGTGTISSDTVTTSTASITTALLEDVTISIADAITTELHPLPLRWEDKSALLRHHLLWWA